MIELFETQIATQDRKSSKGNQLKWFDGEKWYKADYTGTGLNKCLYSIQNHEERLHFLAEQTERITGLVDFGTYLCKMLCIDTFFLNEDRHTHNIAVLMDKQGNYQLCPFFDQGAGLLSDTSMDYPLHGNIYEFELQAKPQTFCQDFDEQLDIAEKLFGQCLRFSFTQKDASQLLDSIEYNFEIKERIKNLIYNRMRKFSYLFS